MIYKVTLNDKVYEVEVEQGEAVMLSITDVPIGPAAALTGAVPFTPASAAVPAIPAIPMVSAAPAAANDATGYVDGVEVISSPLPGSVIEMKVVVGQSVKRGQVLVLIEAMKMENEVLAPRDGAVRQIFASKGATVETGTPLLTLS